MSNVESKKVGHIVRMCRSKPNSRNSHTNTTHYVEGEHHDEARSTTEDDNTYSLFTLSTTEKRSDPFYVQVLVFNQPISMEIDTGASLSIISEETYKQLSSEIPLSFQECTTVLKTYTGESLHVLGKITVPVTYQQQKIDLPLLIIEGTSPSLMGRDWLAKLKLNWQEINHLRGCEKLEELLERHSSVFSSKLGCFNAMKAKIYIREEVQPKFFKPRSVPYILREKVNMELDRLQQENVITPVKHSEWAAPFVPVVKQDGSIRICGDYKLTINKALSPDSYPLPKINDLFSVLAGGQTFSKLDLSQAYLQLMLDEESKKYTTINTQKGLFQFNRLPFGISSAPSVFQRVMDTLFQGYEGILVYLDDILVTGSTQTKHLENLNKVLSKLNECGLKLKKSKCIFMAPKVQYLGYIIDKEGLHPSLEKIKGIREAQAPKNVTELRAFLGMLNYYSKFLPNVSSKLAPLYSLLHKSTRWKWDSPQASAFAAAKEML